MALLEMTLRAELNKQMHINRFTYVMSGTPAAVSASFALTHAMGFIPTVDVYPAGSLFALVRAYTTASLVFLETEARDVFSETDFYVTPFAAGVAGTYAGDSGSPTVAFGWRTNRIRRDVRRGTRRIGGVSETLITTGGLYTAAASEALQDIADAFSAVLTYDDEGNTLTFTPAVFGRVSYETPSGRTAYKLHPTEATQLEHTAVGVVWSPYSTTRTQTSRQYGRGR